MEWGIGRGVQAMARLQQRPEREWGLVIVCGGRSGEGWECQQEKGLAGPWLTG